MSLLDRYQTEEEKEKSLRCEIAEILRAYRHPWDIFAESLQNSVDAINGRYRALNDPNYYRYDQLREICPNIEQDLEYKGTIDISWDVQERTLRISDNGLGIPGDKIESYLLPKGSGKNARFDYGFKGFGLTFIAFSSSKFKVDTRFVCNEEGASVALDGCIDWLAKGAPFPSGPIATAEPTQGTDIGTTITVTLDDKYVATFDALSALDNMNDLVKTEADIKKLIFVLRNKTAIGNTRTLFNANPVVPITISLKVKIPGSSDYISTTVPYSYYHPKEDTELSVSSYTFKQYVDNLASAGFDRHFRCLFHPLKAIEIGVFSTKKILVDIALGAASQTRLGRIESTIGIATCGSDFSIKPGIHLAINGMPTGILVPWNNRGASFLRFYVVVDADISISQQLDPGRKGISSHYMDLIEAKVVDLIYSTRIESSDTFGRYSTINLDTGRLIDEDDTEEDSNLDAMIDDYTTITSAYSSEQLELLSKIQQHTTFTKIPTTENEVIGMFAELVGKGKIKGYSVKTISGRSTYDAIYDFEIEIANENLFPHDVLGVSQATAQKFQNKGSTTIKIPLVKPALCIEFKKNLGELLKEISGRTDKDPAFIDILICWDEEVPSLIQSTLYTIGPIVGEQRRYHSITHRLGLVGLGGHTTELFCIFLKDVICKLSST